MNVETGGGNPSTTSNPLETKLMSHHEDTTSQWRRSTVTEIEEAIDLTWKDPFYDDQPDIIAVFDFPDEDQVAAWFWHQSLWNIWLMWGLAAFYFMIYCQRFADGMILFLGIAHLLGGSLYCLLHNSHNQTCQRAAKEKLQHVAVTTQGVQMDDTIRKVSVLIPFASIQSVDSVNLPLLYHRSSIPCACPYPVVKLTCSQTPTSLSALSLRYTTKIEKQKEFIRLVKAMIKRARAQPKEGRLC